MNSKYYADYSIKRNAQGKFQVYYDGKPIVYREEILDRLVVDERSVYNTFSEASDFIHDEVAEQEICDAEAEQYEW